MNIFEFKVKIKLQFSYFLHRIIINKFSSKDSTERLKIIPRFVLSIFFIQNHWCNQNKSVFDIHIRFEQKIHGINSLKHLYLSKTKPRIFSGDGYISDKSDCLMNKHTKLLSYVTCHVIKIGFKAFLWKTRAGTYIIRYRFDLELQKNTFSLCYCFFPIENGSNFFFTPFDLKYLFSSLWICEKINAHFHLMAFWKHE